MASEELRGLLRSIQPEYEDYAGQLHTAGYRGIVELAAAKPEDVAAQVPLPHATAIVDAAQTNRVGRSTITYLDEDWEELLCGKLFGHRPEGTRGILERVLAIKIDHPRTIADMSDTEVQELLGDRVPPELISWFHELCASHAGSGTFAQVLSRAPQDLDVSQNSSSGSQSSKRKYGHPESVGVWDDFPHVVQKELQQIPVTRPVFPPMPQLMSWASAGEAPCDTALNVNVFQRVDMLLRYLQYKVLIVKKDKKIFEWQQQARSTSTDSEIEHSADSEPEAEESYKKAYSVEMLQREYDRTKDATVREHALRRRKGKLTVMLYETKRPEDIDPLSTYTSAELVELWRNHLTSKTTHSQVLVDVLGQVTNYAAMHGCRYVMFGSYRWNWAGVFASPGHLLLAGPFKCNHTSPTLPQIVYTLSCKAIREPRHNSWTPLPQHPSARRLSNTSSRRSSRHDSEPDQQGPNSAPDAALRGRTPRSSAGQAQQQPSVSTKISTGYNTRQKKKIPDPEISEQQQARNQLPAAQNKAAVNLLAGIAAAADTNDILEVIGHGVTGCVFLLRLTGTLTAAKLAFGRTEAKAALTHEGKILLALQHLWGIHIPGLVGLGAAAKFERQDYMLATQYINGRHLRPALDAHLLPKLQEALHAVHELGVLHGDIRRQNILVSVEDGQQRVWLIDFGFAKQHASKSELAEEMQQLAALFAIDHQR